MKKNTLYFLIIITTLFSCEYQFRGFRFSNFNNTPVEKLAKAVKNENIKKIRNEVLNKKVDINYKDDKYEQPLLSLAILNNKKKSFIELLKLGADPNLYDSECDSPIILAIKYNSNCDLFFIENLIKYKADLTPGFYKKCSFVYSFDPLIETISNFEDENNEQCLFDILQLISNNIENLDLNEFNDAENFKHNIVYYCLAFKNISALKYLVVDLKYKVPDSIFVDGLVLMEYYPGYKNLKEILSNKDFIFEYSNYREKARIDLLKYLVKNKGNGTD